MAPVGMAGYFLILSYGAPALAEESPELRNIKGFKAMVLEWANGDRMPTYASIENIEIRANTDQVSNRDARAALADLVIATAKEELELRLSQVTLGKIKVGSSEDTSTAPQYRCKVLLISFSVTLSEKPLPSSKDTIPIGALMMDTSRLWREDLRLAKPCEGAKTVATKGMSTMHLFASADLTAQHALEAMEPALRSWIVNLVGAMAIDDDAALAEIRKWDD